MIDWNRVIDLRDAMRPDDTWPLIEAVLTEIEAHLSALDRRVPYLAEDLHLLFGLGATIGFSDFCDLCRRGEQQLLQTGRFDLGIPALRASFGHARQLFLRDLPHVIGDDRPDEASARAS